MKFLRFVNLTKWEKHPKFGCPDKDGLRGDALYDMKTVKCRLSVYEVTDAINLERVSVAYS